LSASYCVLDSKHQGLLQAEIRKFPARPWHQWRHLFCAMQIRAAALTGTQCASYEQAKRLWMQHTGMGDNPGTHLGASMITGLATTTITAPVDLIKTNMFVGELALAH
jgi:hypothetical protein